MCLRYVLVVVSELMLALLPLSLHATVFPPLFVDLDLKEGNSVADGYDLDGEVSVVLPGGASAGASFVVVRLAVQGDGATVDPTSLSFDSPPTDTAMRQSVRGHVGTFGEAEVTAFAESYDAQGEKLWGRADSVFILALPQGTRIGKSSLFDLKREQLADDLAAGRIASEEFERGMSALLADRIPEVGTLRVLAPRSAPALVVPAVVHLSVVSGNVRYVVSGGTTAAGPYRAIVGATVEFVDRTPAGDVAIGPVLHSDAHGHYSAAMPGQRSDGTAVNLVVRVLSDSIPASVGPSGQRALVWVAEGGPQILNTPTTRIDVTVGPEQLVANGAFSILDAVTVAFNFLQHLNSQTGVGANPATNPLRFIEFPGDSANGSYFSQNPDAHLNIGGREAFEWDVVHHEYGHYVQFLNGTLAGIGGEHFISGNNTGNNCAARDATGCTVPRTPALNKDQGTRLAWGEGWPTYFGTGLQRAMHADTFNVPTAGDTRYTDSANGIDYDLENNVSVSRGRGEDNELAVQRILWDVFDTPRDESDVVSFGLAPLWKLTIGGTKPVTVSAFWNVLRTQLAPGAGGTLMQALVQYGAIFGDHGVSPLAQQPPEHTVMAPHVPLTFSWRTQGAGGDPNPIGEYKPSYHLNKFRVVFYNQYVTKVIFTSPEIVTNGSTDAVAQYAPTAAEWTAILKAGNSSVVKWTVEGLSDAPAPLTGTYPSNARTLVPKVFP
jgi:hypothetical protein